MIESFKIRNFKSILDLNIDLHYGEKSAPRHFEQSENWPFLSTRSGKNGRFVPVMAVYGANASGKSNIINAILNFLRLLQQGVPGCFVPNKLNQKYEDAGFEVVVLMDAGRFRYSIDYSNAGVVRESVLELPLDGSNGGKLMYSIDGESSRFDGVESEGYDSDRLNQALRIECRGEDGALIRPFLPCLARAFPGLTVFAQKLLQEFLYRLQVSNRNEFFISQGIDLLAQFTTAEARDVAMGKIVKILRKFDFGVRGMTMNRQKVGKNAQAFPQFGTLPLSPTSIVRDAGDAWIVDEIKLMHENAAGDNQPLDFATEESEGTKVVAALIGVCLWALETGRTLFVDELDRSLHPFILLSLIKMFKSKRYNKTNAQLVFTAHDATPLEEDLLRISEVGIVDRTLKEGTSFRRLCEFGDVRNVTNFRKQYLSGAYSGIPFPYI